MSIAGIEVFFEGMTPEEKEKEIIRALGSLGTRYAREKIREIEEEKITGKRKNEN